jgi:hypothetical protein
MWLLRPELHCSIPGGLRRLALTGRPAHVMWLAQSAQQLDTVVIWRTNMVRCRRRHMARAILARKHPPTTDRVPDQYRGTQTPPPIRQGRRTPGTAAHQKPRCLLGSNAAHPIGDRSRDKPVPSTSGPSFRPSTLDHHPPQRPGSVRVDCILPDTKSLPQNPDNFK